MFGSNLKYDVFERALWTGAEGALGILVISLAGVSAWWAAPVALVLAAGKAWVAGRLGRSGTGSTLPESKDPATPPRTVGLGTNAGAAEGPFAP